MEAYAPDLLGREPILRIHIEKLGTPSGFSCELGAVRMIPFRGEAYGKRFNGKVLPSGVDTQIVNAAGVRHMSARYMLTGTDDEGRECSIYIENNGWFDDRARTKPFYTVPTFLTDSPSLAPYLHRSQFIGQGKHEEDGLWINIFEVSHENYPAR